MPGLRPERAGTGSNGGPERLATLAEALFHITEEGNKMDNRLISAAC
jgi:hypothetical protein